jgi:hypothetical protein
VSEFDGVEAEIENLPEDIAPILVFVGVPTG